MYLARLLIHGTSHGKKMLRQLPESKTLIVRECGGSGYVFSLIFIANFQCLEDVLSSSTFGGEVLDEGIDGGDRSNGGSGWCRGDSGFSVSHLLRVVIPLGFPRCLRGPAFVCAVSFLVASEAKSFSNASGTISWRDLFQANRVDIHGVRIFGRAQVGGK